MSTLHELRSRATAPLAGHSPGQERPLGGYATLTGTFLALSGAFATWFRRSGRALPDRIDPADAVLLTLAAHKAARTLSHDRVASAVRAPFTEFQGDDGPAEVAERARGRGLHRAVGELLVCPFCLGMWMSALLTAMLLVAPRLTRWIATVWAMFFGSEMLQIAYRRAEMTLERPGD